MAKIVFTADTMMSILKKVFEDEDLETIVETDREEWKDKTLAQILNIDLYTHKHTVPSTIEIKDELMAQGEDSNRLDVLKRSFCLVSLEEVQRLYSKDIDQIAVSGTLQFWLQAEKVKLLEAFIEAVNIALCGEKLTINIQGETRKATLFFGRVSSNIDGQTEIGESAVATVKITMMVTPNIVSYSDYSVKFFVPIIGGNGEKELILLPLNSFSYTTSMAQKSVTFMIDPLKNSAINQSNVVTFVLGFDGQKDNRVIEMFANDTFLRGSSLEEISLDNNDVYLMQIERNGRTFNYSVKIKEHSIMVNNDTGFENHKLILTTGD